MTSATQQRAGTKGVARADREHQILEVAAQAFGTVGFAATNLADVAVEAGISKPLIYSYFGSKEGLYEACLVRFGALIADDVDRTAASGTIGLARALVTLEGIFAMLEGRRWIWRLFFDPTRPTTPSIEAVIARYTGRITSRAEEGIAELMAHVDNSDPQDRSALAAVWSATFDGLVNWWIAHPEVNAEEMSARCVRLALAIAAP